LYSVLILVTAGCAMSQDYCWVCNRAIVGDWDSIG